MQVNDAGGCWYTLSHPHICELFLYGPLLLYLHQAANILLDQSGRVMLADLGVTCQMSRNFSMDRYDADGRRGTLAYLSRTTFAGTPCWMAPEVMEESVGCASVSKSCVFTVVCVLEGHHLAAGLLLWYQSRMPATPSKLFTWIWREKVGSM